MFSSGDITAMNHSVQEHLTMFTVKELSQLCLGYFDFLSLAGRTRGNKDTIFGARLAGEISFCLFKLPPPFIRQTVCAGN